MTTIPPEMVFEGEEEFEEKPRRFESPRYVYEWERTIEKVQYPSDRFSFEHGGTVYRATNAADIALMRQAVERRNA